MTTIGFLHTAAVHVETFRALLAGVDVDVVEVVRSDLLERAVAAGPASPTVVQGVAGSVDELVRAGADLVVCTCSTIGDVAERSMRGPVRVIRVDRPMAERAVDEGERIAVVAALASTVEPTSALLRSVADERGRPIELSVHLVPRAWAHFESGAMDDYSDAVAEACREVAPSADVIVLAQASMAGALTRVAPTPPVLASPALAVSWIDGWRRARR